MTSHCAQVDCDDLAEEVKVIAMQSLCTTRFKMKQTALHIPQGALWGRQAFAFTEDGCQGGGEGQGTGIFVSFASTHVSIELGI